MVYSNSANSATNYTRYYAASFEKTVYSNNIKQVHYINTPMGVTAVYIKDNTSNNDKIFHLLSDHQGTIITILSETGQVLENNSYDAWGRKRNYNSLTGILSYNNVTYGLLSRGYTGHEMLLEVGLINMNGRLYDPLLGRMLSPDNFVHDPGNTQGYNRYAYCFNNPLKYIDPSGQIPALAAAIIIGAVISATTYTYQVATSPGGFNNWNWMEFGFRATTGGLMGGLTWGIGQGALAAASYFSTSVTANILIATAQAVTHGVIQGVMSMGSGGTFWQGFASGAASSAVSSILGSSLGDGGMVLAGGLTGGVANMIAGGDFMRGFMEGAIVSALNHVAHKGLSGKGIEGKDDNFENALKRVLRDANVGEEISSEDLITKYGIPKTAASLINSFTKTTNSSISVEWASSWSPNMALAKSLSSAVFNDGKMSITYAKNGTMQLSGNSIGIKYGGKIYNNLIIQGNYAEIRGLNTGMRWKIGL